MHDEKKHDAMCWDDGALHGFLKFALLLLSRPVKEQVFASHGTDCTDAFVKTVCRLDFPALTVTGCDRVYGVVGAPMKVREVASKLGTAVTHGLHSSSCYKGSMHDNCGGFLSHLQLQIR